MSADFKIKNFQSIKDADIKADGFTILVGESSQGKSACLRAINAACNNKFKQNFLRYGADTIEVDIDYNEGSKLQVTKTKKESPTYKLNDLVFQKLNRTVPDEVNDFNNFGVIDYFEQKYPLNYFSQFAKPLLLEFSQKRILEILSSSKAYDDMNTASTNLNKHKEQNNGAFKQLSSMLSDNKNQLSVLKKQRDTIEGGIMQMRDCQQSLTDIDKTKTNITELTTLYDTYNKSNTRLSVLLKLQETYDQYNDIHTILDKACELDRLISESDSVNDSLNVLNEDLSKCDKCLSIKKDIDNLNFESVTTLDKLITEHKQFKEKYKVIEHTFTRLSAIMDFKKNIEICDNQLNKLNTLSDLMGIAKSQQEELKKKEYMVNNRICPICGNKI